jgi:hypothetical protein
MSTVTQIHQSRSGIAEALRAAAQPIELDTAHLADTITTYCQGLA